MELTEGLTATVTLTVTEADTAMALRSGDVPVLATPRVIALVEEATVAAVAASLDPGLTTVGTSVLFDHLAPTPVGGTVVARAELSSVRGREISFNVSVHEGQTHVAGGVIRRIVVERARFLEKAGAS
jgi:predicted thioesterase